MLAVYVNYRIILSRAHGSSLFAAFTVSVAQGTSDGSFIRSTSSSEAWSSRGKGRAITISSHEFGFVRLQCFFETRTTATTTSGKGRLRIRVFAFVAGSLSGGTAHTGIVALIEISKGE